jgi:hypothetical protein
MLCTFKHPSLDMCTCSKGAADMMVACPCCMMNVQEGTAWLLCQLLG